jgi:hypothetical protein
MSQSFTVNINGTLTTITVDIATSAKQDSQITEAQSTNAKIGEVQASPTQYTLLDRLKAIYTALTGTLNVNIVSGGGGSSGGLTDAELRATPVPVSGTVTANTGLSQPLTDTQLRSSAVPVSLASVPSHAVTNAGTFAVQVTSAPTTAVTGTFWQATQPVSLASIPSHDVTNAGTFAVQVTSAPTTAVTGTFWQATQPVSIASLPALAAGTALIGKVGIDQTTPGTTNAVAVQPIALTATDKSGTITTGGTAQNAIAANSNRKGWMIQNISDTDMYINEAGTATTGKFLLKSGASAVSQGNAVTTGAISILCATTGKAFAGVEYT